MRPTFRPLLLLLVLSFASATATASEADFSACLERLGAQARAQGVGPALIADTLGQVRHLPRVLELDRAQPEFSNTFAGYFPRRVSETRIANGRRLLAEHQDLLLRIQRETGVPARYLVAFWGLESNYGSYLGNHKVLDALATLACDDRRAAFFSDEFVQALQIVDRGDIAPEQMIGSWAGAMGNVQFMPSTYLRYAVDADGDGRRDLWGSLPDALESAARFLAALGWQRQLRWGREVRLPAAFDYGRYVSTKTRPLSEFARAGVRNAFGGALPPLDHIEARLVLPAGHQGPAFIVYANFDVIMGWNRSLFYGLAVGRLADRIGGGGPLRRPIPAGPERLRLDDVRAMQRRLSNLGFDTAGVDGRIGPATRAAVAAFQRSEGLVGDGYPDPKTLSLLGL